MEHADLIRTFACDSSRFPVQVLAVHRAFTPAVAVARILGEGPARLPQSQADVTRKVDCRCRCRFLARSFRPRFRAGFCGNIAASKQLRVPAGEEGKQSSALFVLWSFI